MCELIESSSDLGGKLRIKEVVQPKDRPIEWLNISINPKFVSDEIADRDESLLTIKNFLFSAWRNHDLDRGHMPIAQNAINQFLLFRRTPHLSALEIWLQVEVATFNSGDDCLYVGV